MRYKHLPPVSLDNNGNLKSYVFDISENEYIDMEEFHEDKKQMAEYIDFIQREIYDALSFKRT